VDGSDEIQVDTDGALARIAMARSQAALCDGHWRGSPGMMHPKTVVQAVCPQFSTLLDIVQDAGKKVSTTITIITITRINRHTLYFNHTHVLSFSSHTPNEAHASAHHTFVTHVTHATPQTRAHFVHSRCHAAASVGRCCFLDVGNTSNMQGSKIVQFIQFTSEAKIQKNQPQRQIDTQIQFQLQLQLQPQCHLKPQPPTPSSIPAFGLLPQIKNTNSKSNKHQTSNKNKNKNKYKYKSGLPYDIRSVTMKLLMELYLETPGALTVSALINVSCSGRALVFSW
jgi:hypothetical protein